MSQDNFKLYCLPFGLFESTNITGTLENKRLLEYFISPEKRR